MLSTKTKRSAPPKVLENYVASIKRLQGSPISISDLGFPSGQFISSGATTTPSDINNIDIGFVVKINDINYNRAYISEYGHLALIEGSTSFSTTDVYIAPGGNNTINSSFTKNHILICPWWDNAAVPPKDVDTLAASSEYNGTLNTAQEVLDIKNGIDLRNWPFSPYDRGARYKIINDSQNGKCFVVRWTISQSLFGNKLKFEAAIYENGKFQFRYWPIEEYQQGDSIATTSATVGVFWSGPKFGSDKFRDLSPLIDYKKNLRQLNELGGASYDSSYSEIFKPYSNEISKTYWPGPAEITFSPPVNSVKFLPKKSIRNISDSRDITTTSGLFDDRRTINFSSNAVVHMPLTLPTRLLGDSGGVDVSIRQHLYTSGSLQVTGAVNKSAVDGLLAQINAEQEARTSADFSFDESKKNYELTSFYMTGSALAQFGEGFTSPLSSKTRFQLSLPVEKPIEMLSLTSSMYYYNIERKSWDLMSSPIINNNLIASVVDTVGRDANVYVYIGGQGKFTNLSVETSIGFDAVGRKIVSGSRDAWNAIQLSNDYMTGLGDSNGVLTSICNAYSDVRLTAITNEDRQVENCLTQKFSKSFTDEKVYYPLDNQKVYVGNQYPFLIEKIAVEIPFSITSDWFLDKTTCNMAIAVGDIADGKIIGPIDFGGPGITFAIHSAKKASDEKIYLDLIASGTITHQFDNNKSYSITQPAASDSYLIAPTGFLSFGTPSAVIEGVYDGASYSYTGKVRLELQPSVSSGIITAIQDYSQQDNTATKINDNRTKAKKLFTTKVIPTLSSSNSVSWSNSFNTVDSTYLQRKEKTHIFQVSPLSRGTSEVEFNGSSILGNIFAGTETEKTTTNPLFVAESENDLPTDITNAINSANFSYNAVSLLSTVDSKVSPYLLMPGENIFLSISKTRPVISSSRLVESYVGYTIPNKDPLFSTVSPPYIGTYIYRDYTHSGTHDTVTLNTGSIDITLYGSYISAGAEYHE